MAFRPEEKIAGARGSVYSLLLGCIFALWTWMDKPIEAKIIRGHIPLTWDRVGLALILVLVGCFGLGWAARTSRTARIAKGIATHTLLIFGSFVFSLPLAFLLITSFKEDRDMSSERGIIWIPRVQRTTNYRDPKKPIFDTQFQGVTVEVQILEELPNGRVRVDTNKPFSMRGKVFETSRDDLKETSRSVPIVTAKIDGLTAEGKVIEEKEDGSKLVLITSPATLANQQRLLPANQVELVRDPGLKWQNYPDALGMMPPETLYGWVYLRNTLIIVIFSVLGTLLSSSLVAYAFSRMRFPGRDVLFKLLLGTMMLPGAVTLLPQFLIFRTLGWVDTLLPLWAPAFLGSAFNIFLLRQFFKGIPMELEDAAKIDGCSFVRTYWNVMLPQIKPALVVIFVWTFVGAWNNFMGPLIYINSPENMPLSYALQLFNGERSNEPGLLMAFSTMAIVPVLILFFSMQRYFIEGVSLSGLGGR
jgi:multiple sugar transport system permease protein